MVSAVGSVFCVAVLVCILENPILVRRVEGGVNVLTSVRKKTNLG